MMRNVQIVYFSGTGGTARVAASLEKAFAEHGVGAMTIPLDLSKCKSTPSVEESTDLLIIVFPVYAFDAPEPIYDWITGLNNEKKPPVAVISVSGGGEVWPNTDCRHGCIKLLSKKGYEVLYERMMVMPSNLVVATHEQLAVRLLKIINDKAEHCAAELLSGIRRRRKPGITSSIMLSLARIEKQLEKKFGKDLRINHSCTKCGWCARSCPRGNIQMVEGVPKFDDKCIICLRCIYGCPSKAIYTKKYEFIALKEGYDLDKLERRMADIELEPLENIKAGILFAGVTKYLSNIDE